MTSQSLQNDQRTTNHEPLRMPPEEAFDFHEMVSRIGRGLIQTAGLCLVGMFLAGIVALLVGQFTSLSTTTRVIFSFPGFEKGEYPDHSKFQPDDLRSPALISQALRNLGLDRGSEYQSKIRGALSIEGIIPANVLKDRDRLRAAGQVPPTFVPDEYIVTLSLPRNEDPTSAKRALLVNEIISVYRENFQRTYGHLPQAFGTAFQTLKDADFPEYELVLNTELDNIRNYLTDQIEQAKSFRSPSTNFSFKDLLQQTNLFAQIQLNETLGLIHENGLSRNRETAMMKMTYYLRLLEEKEKQKLDEEQVVTNLLGQTQTRAENYVLGIKDQASHPRSNGSIVDQGLIDSLLANDAYNFLVRRALEAGLEVKLVQAEKNRLQSLHQNMKSFVRSDLADQSAIVERAQRSLGILENKYNILVENIRVTSSDYSRRQFANAIQLADETRTAGWIKPLAIDCFVGGFLGLVLGLGLSLLNFPKCVPEQTSDKNTA